MTLPYVRLENNEAIEARKNILASQMSLLNITKKLESYKKLRKQELVKKYLLKRALRQKIMRLNSLIALLPEPEASSLKGVKHKILKHEAIPVLGTKESKKSRDIEAQLAEIREKISHL